MRPTIPSAFFEPRAPGTHFIQDPHKMAAADHKVKRSPFRVPVIGELAPSFDSQVRSFTKW